MKKEIRNRAVKKVILSFLLCCFKSFLSGQQIPAYSVIVFDTTSSEGYYFLAPKFDPLVGTTKEIQLILDKYGEVIYYHNWPYDKRASDFKIQCNGLMSYYQNKKFYLMDSTFTVIDTIKRKNGLLHDEHDFQVLPNGHFLMLAAEEVQMDLSAYPIFKHNLVPGSASATVRCNVIQEQDSAKNVVFEWHAKDYFIFTDTDSAYLTDTNFVDWTHSNSVSPDTDGNILLSSRQFNEITKINRNDSSIIWRLGGNQNQFTFINDSNGFKKQHDCRRLPNGNITLFDNGKSSPFHPATASEYLLDETQMTATLVWSYIFDSTLYSKSRGNVQRLSNGNTLISYGDLNGSNILFNCVDSTGHSIIELRFADSLLSYRAFNYPQLPWDLNRPKITCKEIAGKVFLSVDSGLGTYHWSTGAAAYKIAITNTDTFFVFVPRGNGGFIKSEPYIVSDLSDPCSLLSGINTYIPDNGWSLLPNPVSDNLHLKCAILKDENALIRIFDAFGRQVFLKNERIEKEITIPVSSLAPGIYTLCANGVRMKFIKI